MHDQGSMQDPLPTAACLLVDGISHSYELLPGLVQHWVSVHDYLPNNSFQFNIW